MHFTIIAGEASGDLLGGPLASALKTIDDGYQIDGIGGPKMRAAGVHTLFDIEDTAVMGLVEVVRHYPRLKKILNSIKQHLTDHRPDLLILIDYPEFNFRLAKFASQHGIPVMYYVSPQIWAWRKKRVHKLKQWIQLIAVLFPFEVKFYQQYGVPSCLARHPLVDQVTQHAKPPREINATTDFKVALLPGSRHSEIERLLTSMLQAAELLKTKYPNATFHIPVASEKADAQITALCPKNVDYICLKSSDLNDACAQCDVAVVASGTATLNIAMLGIPMIIVYRVSPITYWLLKPFIRLKSFGLANIVLDKQIYPELLQHSVSGQTIADEIEKLIIFKNIRESHHQNGLSIQRILNEGLNADQLAQQATELARLKK